MAFNSMNDGDDAPMSDINVTPLVDVMLVLLIVFMITMPVLTHSIQINLPVASENTKPEQINKDLKPLEIAVDTDGKYTIGADSANKVDLLAVKTELARIAAENPDTIIAIDADEKTAYDNVLKLLEAAKEAKLTKVGFRMEVKNAPLAQ
ncbi:MAG: biopolymer transporter ExbD [Alysiella sp.]|uniref:biopolymer transporter ExbD n=1 Tax=Alysiella sp. TaxID=1872483 RepID=UPI0026DC48C0|nr:biopolymer transporter ExbD [Alysiella sp.]MDO4433584.1 biopolymer transporter ExbD [Alysiella sp.]